MYRRSSYLPFTTTRSTEMHSLQTRARQLAPLRHRQRRRRRSSRKRTCSKGNLFDWTFILARATEKKNTRRRPVRIIEQLWNKTVTKKAPLRRAYTSKGADGGEYESLFRFCSWHASMCFSTYAYKRVYLLIPSQLMLAAVVVERCEGKQARGQTLSIYLSRKGKGLQSDLVNRRARSNTLEKVGKSREFLSLRVRRRLSRSVRQKKRLMRR